MTTDGGTVSDESVAQALCDRLENGLPYTWASATMLVAHPTYRDTTALDEEATEEAHIYADLPSLSPSPQALAVRVYHKMVQSQASQSILYSGMTDAGKTFTMLRVTDHLIALSASHSQQESQLADRIQCAQQVLSAMGCAKTSSNEQASRHATYWELHFTVQGRLAGAKVLTFGLDQHRLHRLPTGERSFAIFYQMLAGATRKERSDYRLDELNLDAVPTREDARSFEWTRSAFARLGMKQQHVQGLLRVLASILHILAIEFADAEGQVQIVQPAKLSCVADLLQVSAADLQQSLVMDTLYVQGARTTHMLDAQGARQQRDTLAHQLYAVLFAFVVEVINQKLASTEVQPLHIVQLDSPGFVSRVRLPHRTPRASHYDDLVKNYMADLLRHLCVRSILDPSGWRGVCSDEGLPVPEVHIPSDCMLLLRGEPVPLRGTTAGDAGALRPSPPALATPTGGLLADYARVWSAVLAGERTLDDDGALLADMKRHADHHALVVRSDEGVFDIQHSLGSCSYSVLAHQRSELDWLPTQQLSMLRASREAFVARLMAGPGLAIESRLSEQVLLRAQVSSRPLRRPSRLGASVAWPETRLEGVLQQVDSVLQSLWHTMQQADTCWHVLCVRSMDWAQPGLDAQRISAQVHALGLTRLVSAQRYSYVYVTREAFAAQFGDLEQAIQSRGWSVPEDLSVGETLVALSYPAWFSLSGSVSPMVRPSVPLVRLSQAPPPSAPTPYLHDPPHSGVSLLKPEPLGDELDAGLSTAWAPMVDSKEALMPPTEMDEEPMSRERKFWSRLTWLMTLWVPDSVLKHVLGKTRPDVRMAWREKVTICLLIFLLCALILFYIIGLGQILCPNFNRAWNEGQLSEHGDGQSFYVAVAGNVYDITKFYKLDHSDIPSMPVTQDVMMQLAGQDLTPYFPVPLSVACNGLVQDGNLQLSQQENLTAPIAQAVHNSGAAQHYKNTKLNNPSWYYQRFLPTMKKYHKGTYVYDKKRVETDGSWRSWAIVHNRIYDLTNYLYTQQQHMGDNKYQFLHHDLVDLFQAQAGSEISGDFDDVMKGLSPKQQQQQQHCLDQAFYVGELDFRLEAQCLVQNYLLLSFSIIIFISILAKFLSALQLAHRPSPEQQERFVILHIPCYTEGEESLRKTIESLAVQEYDDKRKLLFIVCDGMIVGSGNELATPRIVLDILGVDASVDAEPLPFKSVADGSKQLNYGKVYSGLFECEGHIVPFMVIVKVGRPSERSRPGNRGKRDTQILLMRFLNRVHFDAPMYPLELEMYHHMKNVIGIDPSFYEYILMVDADTLIAPDGLNRLVAAAVEDPSTIAVCGETLIENEKKTVWTMVQVYEYYISHNLAKAFESLFGSVTCLPGCFSMYRLRSSDKGRPLFISDKIIDDYAENRVDTLHKKNLLALGEDRYLTTLLLKHFPLYRTRYRHDAKAMTAAPESFSVLLSQRRRWINSTVHNLVELVKMKGLCGFCLFSMRFIVFIDLLGTILLPATAVYMVYLIVTVATGQSPIPVIALAMIGAVYGLQAIVFLLRRQWQYLGWMVIYLVAYPLYSFLIPIYSFWHMDDFSWGNTRIVVGEKGNKKVVAGTDDEPYDDSMIPRKSVTEYQQELYGDEEPMLLYDPPLPPTTSFSPPSEAEGDYFQHTNLRDKAHRSQRMSTASWMPSGDKPCDSLASFPSMNGSGMGWPLYAPPMASFPSMYGMPMYPSFPSDMGTPFLPASTTDHHTGLPILYTQHPTEEQIRTAIQSYLASQPSLTDITKRHVRDAVAASMPHADLSGQKALMNHMIDELLSDPMT
ncbi:chitin synthase [Malassezia nana]|uniref:chitin synthase n=1 Tax=Malassezia nana TaxID=180528 RepID=A0AAF0J1U8_9BASI|nr:chitin synthase [Malassezia nana]